MAKTSPCWLWGDIFLFEGMQPGKKRGLRKKICNLQLQIGTTYKITPEIWNLDSRSNSYLSWLSGSQWLKTNRPATKANTKRTSQKGLEQLMIFDVRQDIMNQNINIKSTVTIKQKRAESPTVRVPQKPISLSILPQQWRRYRCQYQKNCPGSRRAAFHWWIRNWIENRSWHLESSEIRRALLE